MADLIEFPGPAKKRPAPERLSRPVATVLLCLGLAAVYLWQSGLDGFHDMVLVHGYGLIPAELFGLRTRAPQIPGVPPVATLITAQGLHGGWVHLIGNLVAILMAGILLERRAGALRLVGVFVVSGAAGLALEAAATPGSTIPIIGASAGAAGLIGGALRRDPWGQVHIPLPGRGGVRRRSVPALPLIGAWLILQVFGIAFAAGEPIAFLAHGGGFVAGVLLAGGRPAPAT
jgi:membrane associated rhomboid family serine protease